MGMFHWLLSSEMVPWVGLVMPHNFILRIKRNLEEDYLMENSTSLLVLVLFSPSKNNIITRFTTVSMMIQIYSFYHLLKDNRFPLS